ncbi:PTS sugar transporter subunit IIA [uncultured Anaerococcus sp.]|uniref:PTS sugar transporter subunit IIA n=1 Tax=uncultured Anaerococcus sp. TaxID=293428 RepID=UPI00288B7B39|nr:PTS sugar transporter subunit IIA [uncultured Anaerococcus sp.]
MGKIFNNYNVNICDGIIGWKDAIILSAKPLLNDAYIGEEYLDAIFDNLEKYGPYIDFGLEVAVPHARPEFGVKKTGVSLLKLKNKVYLQESDDHPIKLIITFCSVDDTSHIEILKEISSIFGDGEKLGKIKEANSVEEILEIINN